MVTIYPSPGSFNQFCARNPEIESRTEQLRCLSREYSMWRATGDEIDIHGATLSTGESKLRGDRQAAIDRGEVVVRLVEWPKVGCYEVPEILKVA